DGRGGGGCGGGGGLRWWWGEGDVYMVVGRLHGFAPAEARSTCTYRKRWGSSFPGAYGAELLVWRGSGLGEAGFRAGVTRRWRCLRRALAGACAGQPKG